MKLNNSSGQISKYLIILAVIVFVLIIIVYGIVRFASNRRQEAPPQESQPAVPEQIEIKPVYETQIGDVKFLLLSSENLGNLVVSKTAFEKDLVTTEKFVKVVVGAQNKGKNNIDQFSWDVGNIIDSDGRNFVSINDRAYSHLPQPDLCGALLKPEFAPLPCVKYYEVSRQSKNLKVVVRITQPKKQEALIDLIVQ